MEQVDFDLTLIGERTLMTHNGRLADPMDHYARQLKALTSKRGKSDEQLLEIMDIEARGGCYETGDAMVGLPVTVVLACIVEGARLHRWGAKVERALIPLDGEVVAPLLYKKGKALQPIDCDKWVADYDNRDVRGVVVMGKRVMRARPIFPPGWQATFRFGLIIDVLNLHDLATALDTAGTLIGVGELRPRFGTFSYKSSW